MCNNREHRSEAKTKDFILVFTSILYEALPFIILGAVLAGILEELVPQGLIPRLGLYAARAMKRYLPRKLFWVLFPLLKFLVRNRPVQIMLSAWLGLLFPMCECGIIPVMRRLLRKGLPLSCCVSYLLAGPIINVVVMLSTYMAFYGRENDPDPRNTSLPDYQLGGIGMTFWRITIGFLVAVGTSFVVEWQYRRHGNKLLRRWRSPVGRASTMPRPCLNAPANLGGLRGRSRVALRLAAKAVEYRRNGIARFR